MKVLLVAEGPHELGDSDQAGALEILLRRLADRQDMQIERRKVSDRSVHAIHGSGPRLQKRALGWLRKAEREGYDALVLVIDHDGDDERLRHIDAAQEDNRLTDLPRALGVAVHAFDAWILADEAALSAVLGCPVDRQPDPESIKRPKPHCADLRDASGSDLSQTELYAAVAARADPATIEARCPRGFAPFARRARRLGAEHVGTEQRVR